MLSSSPYILTAHKFSCPIQDPQSFVHRELLNICNISYLRKNIWSSYIQWNAPIFMENDLISAIQLGFKQEDACIN